jgi:hypothetical protein
VDEGQCKAGAGGKRYFCSDCSSIDHDDHAPTAISDIVLKIMEDWISYCYKVKISHLRAENEFKSKQMLLEYLDKLARQHNIDIPSLPGDMNMIFELSVKI